MVQTRKKKQPNTGTQRRTRNTTQEEVEYPPTQPNPVDEVAANEGIEEDMPTVAEEVEEE